MPLVVGFLFGAVAVFVADALWNPARQLAALQAVTRRAADGKTSCIDLWPLSALVGRLFRRSRLLPTLLTMRLVGWLAGRLDGGRWQVEVTECGARRMRDLEGARRGAGDAS